MNASMPRFNLYSIRTQVIIVVVAVVVLSVAITQIVSVLTTRGQLIDEAEVNITVLAEDKAFNIAEVLNDELVFLQILADNEATEAAIVTQNEAFFALGPDILESTLLQQNEAWQAGSQLAIDKTGDANQEAVALREFLELVPNFTVAYLTDRNGILVAASEFVPNYLNVNTEDWQAAWNNGQGAIYISDDRSASTIVEQGLLIAIPIEVNDEVIGVLHAVYDVTSLQQEISFLTEVERSFIINENDEIILGADISLSGQVIDNLPEVGVVETVNDPTGTRSVGTVVEINTNSVFDSLNWSVALFEDEDTVYSAANDALNAVIVPSIVVVLAAVVIAVVLAQRITAPIVNLSDAATRMSRERDYSTRIDVSDRSELGQLGQSFNAMAQEVQSLVGSLEERVAERVRDLEATVEVGRLATTIADDPDLLPRIVNIIRERFDLYYVQVYLLDEAQRYAILEAGTGQVGTRLLKQNHRLDMNDISIVSRTVQSARPVLVATTVGSSIHLPNPLLPQTRSELAIPLSVGSQLFGVLDMQAIEPHTFNEENVSVFEAMATQVAGILRSNAAVEDIQEAVARADELNRRLVRENWEGYLGRVSHGKRLGYMYDLESPKPIDAQMPALEGHSEAVVPIRLGAQQIGNIVVSESGQKDWTPDELRLVQDVASRVAQSIEQLRTFDETETRARELALVAEVGARATSTLDPNELLQSVVELTRESFNLYHVQIYLLDRDNNRLVLAAGSGEAGKAMVATRHSISLRQQQSLVVRTATERKSAIVNDVTQIPDFLPNPLLPDTLSEMTIPLLARGELLGVYDVQASEINRFSEEDLNIQTTLVGQLAVSLANAQLFEQTQIALQEAALLYQTSQSLSTAQNYQQILQIFSHPLHQYGVKATTLNLVQLSLDAEPELMNVIVAHGDMNIPLTATNTKTQLEFFTLGETPQTSVFISDLKKHTHTWPDFVGEYFEAWGVRALAAVPLVTANRWLGTLLAIWDEPHDFNELESRYLRLIGPQIASLVDSFVSLDDSRNRAIEMQVVAEVSSAASALTDFDTLLKNFANLTRDKFNRYHAQIYLYDPERESLVLAAGSGAVGDMMAASGHSLSMRNETSLVVRAARTRRGVVANDVSEESDFLPNPLLPETRAELAIPILVGDELLGVLDVQDSAVGVFGDMNIQAKQTLANQIGVAIQNTRAFDRSQTLQTQFQAVLDNASSAFISIDTEQNITLFNRTAEQLFGYTQAEVLGQPLDLLIPERFTTVHRQHIQDFANEPTQMRGMAERYTELYARRKDGSEFPVEVALSKLEIGGRLQFTAVLNDISIRKESERELRKRAVELQTVAELSAATSTILERDILLKTISNLTRERFGLYHAHIYLFDEAQQTLVLEAGAGQVGDVMRNQRRSIPIDRENSLVARAARTRQGIIVNDVLNQPDFLPNPLLPETRAELSVPILAGNQLLGVLDVQADTIDYFTTQDVRIFTTFADQISVALQNAELFTETQRRLRETEASNLIAEFMRDETEVSDELLEGIASVLLTVLEATNAVYSRFNALEQQWYGVVGVGEGMTTEIAKTIIDPAAAYPHGVAAIDGGIVIPVENAKDYPNFPPEYTDEASIGIKSVLVLPISLGNQRIGVIFLNYTKFYRRFSIAELNAAQGFANQISAGLERIQTAEEVARRAAELQVVAEVSAAASTILEPQELLQTITALTRERFNLYHAQVYLYDDEHERLVLAAGSGEAGQTMLAAKHQISINQPTSLVARAARTRQGVIANDVTAEADFLPNPILPETLSEMAIPILSGNELLGVLDVQANVANRFTEQDVQIESTLARQISVALSNANLYQEQLLTADRLREVDRLKSEFLASMSHELRTPLNSIIGYAEVILDGLDGPLNEEMQEDIGAIHGSGKLLLTLINDILDLAKIEAGQMELEYEEMEVATYVRRSLDSAYIHVKDRPIELVARVDDACPETFLADPVRLQQIANNLLSNAAKFTEEGSITFAADMVGDAIRFSVIDTGLGISAHQLDVIFERFRQADQSSTRRAGGTGLGLDITRRLVRMHGGEIRVESQLGEGSNFNFTIPLTPPEEPVDIPSDASVNGASD